MKDRGSTSPYTAPSATSTTNLSMLAYAESHQGQAQLTPMNEETDYFNQAAQQKVEQVNTITMLLRVMMSLMTTPHYHLVLNNKLKKDFLKSWQV